MEQEPVAPNNPQSDNPPPGTSGNATPPPVVAYCRACGRGLTSAEVRPKGDTVYCADHVPQPSAPHTAASSSASSAPSSSSASNATPSSGTSPGLAFMLGLIPGVGAIYNGQFAKAVVHLLITTLVCSLAGQNSGSMEPLFDLLVPVWVFYMALEAYQTAKKKQVGETVDEFSSIFPTNGAGMGLPLLPILLIGIGVLFLLDNLQLLRLRQLLPYAGPIFLIALGAYMLYARLRSNTAREVSHERN